MNNSTRRGRRRPATQWHWRRRGDYLQVGRLTFILGTTLALLFGMVLGLFLGSHLGR